MTKKKETVLQKDGYKTVWTRGDPGFVHVDVFRVDTEDLVLEWSYRMSGSIATSAAIWLDQAILEAKRAEE